MLITLEIYLSYCLISQKYLDSFGDRAIFCSPLLQHSNCSSPITIILHTWTNSVIQTQETQKILFSAPTLTLTVQTMPSNEGINRVQRQQQSKRRLHPVVNE